MKTHALIVAVLAAACSGTHGRPVDYPMLDENNQTLASERSGTGGETVARETYELTYDPGAETPAAVTQAVAVMVPTKGNTVMGTVSFLQTDDGVAVHAVLRGVPSGAHALHVHMLGDCSGADGLTAGGPFAFEGSSTASDANAILGGMGEVTAKRDGTATIEIIVPGATLQGEHTIIGRSVIVHENGNDLSKPPDGNAGARLACGVIGVRAGAGAP